MRHVVILFISLALAACTLVRSFDERDHAYIAVEFPPENGQLLIAKIAIIRDRAASPVFYEATGRTTETNFIRVFKNSSTPFSLAERSDGSQVYVSLGSGIGNLNAAEVRVFDVGSLERRLRVTENDVVRESFIACSLEQDFNARILSVLADRGFRTDLPFDVSFRPVPMEERDRDFDPLGWTNEGDFAIAFLTTVDARIQRDGRVLTTIRLSDARDRYMLYDFSGFTPECATDRPAVLADRQPYDTSGIISDAEGRRFYTMGGRILYSFPVTSAETAIPLSDAARPLAIFGPFQGR